MLIALAFSAAILLAPNSQQANQAAGSDTDVREAIRRLAAEPPDVAREYDHLASQPSGSRKQLFTALPASMKSAVWEHHLLRAVTTHPEFTAEQRSVIDDALRLLSAERYEGESAETRKALRDLTARAQRLFSRDVGLAVFVDIGSDIPFAATPEPADELGHRNASTDAEQRAERDGKRRPPAKAMAMDCDCSVWSDWCAIRNGSGWSCTLANCNLSSFGCGTLGMNYCDGLCVYTNPGGGSG